MDEGENLKSDEVDIPDLRKRRRERRRAGASFFQGSKDVGLFAVGGGEVSVSVQHAIGDVSTALSRLGEACGRAINKIPVSFAKVAIAGFWTGLAALAAYMLFIYRPAAPRVERDLGALSSTIRPRTRFESFRLEVAKLAGEKGGLSWAKPWNAAPAPADKAQPRKSASPEENGAADLEAAKAQEWAKILDSAHLSQDAPGMDKDLGKLSTSVGGKFGAQNVFKEFNAAHAAPRPTLGASLRAAASRALSGFSRQAGRPSTRSRAVRRALSPRAFSQLRLASTLSGMAATVRNEDTMKSLAADAFDQTATSGGTVAPDTISKVPAVTPMGSGAPDMTPANSPTTPAPPVTATNMTPYQNALDQATQMMQKAAMLKLLGMLLIALGGVMLAMGLGLIPNPFTFASGMALKIAGLLMIAMGVFMLMMSAQLGAAAKGIGQSIQAQQGQTTQNDVVQQCADQAMQGTSVENCKHDQAPEMNTTIKQDADKEQSATWTWDAEGGDPADKSKTSKAPAKK